MRMKKEFDVEIIDTDYPSMGVGSYKDQKYMLKMLFQDR